ncbi:MAG: glycerol-3-phosphate acyltransferase [Oscillospiraceae bacterium]|nr:glycerol-3-phosphate acyltransferase [Oscillospiraceae bacterium]
MLTALSYFALFAGAYVLGSASLSIIVSNRLFGGDIRRMGSGNAGATNMTRVFGWGAGVLTLCADAAKAIICMLIGQALFGDVGLAFAGAGCIFGHCYPVLHGFKGGKGVSVGGAIAFGIDWRVGLVVVGAFLIGVLLSKKVSLGSICGALAIFIGARIFHLSDPKIALAAFSMCLVIIRHRANISRLVAGTEPNFKAGKGKLKKTE